MARRGRKGRVKVTDKDLGWRALGRALRDASATAVTVGPRGERNVRLGVLHEYGTSNTPARPHLRPTIDRNWAQYRKLARTLAGLVLVGKMAKRRALQLLGLKVASDVRDRIRAHVPPPNAPSTVAAKGSSTPLIATGQYVQSIKPAVVRK